MMTNEGPPRTLPSGLAGHLQRQRIFYGWVIVFVCFLVLCLAFGVRLSFSIFFEALTRSDTFGWSRGETARVFSLSMLVFAPAGAPVDRLLDRLGACRVFVIGTTIWRLPAS
jgi:MFS transporter, OFA family, oxalate/formate antiporter